MQYESSVQIHFISQHLENNVSLALIRKQVWDVVVLQEQSQLLSWADANICQNSQPYLAELVRGTLNHVNFSDSTCYFDKKLITSAFQKLD